MALSEVIDETIQNVEEHVASLSYISENFVKSFENITALMGENSTIILFITKVMKQPFNEFGNHCSQLFVQDIIAYQ